MKTSKIVPLKWVFKFSARKGEHDEPIIELVHPRIQAKITPTFRSKKASNSLLLLMYSKENEVLFI